MKTRQALKIVNLSPERIRCSRYKMSTLQAAASICRKMFRKRLVGIVGDPEDQYDDYYDLDDSEYDDDDWETAMHECGQLPPHLGGGCQLAATEFCDFECPFRDSPMFEDDED